MSFKDIKGQERAVSFLKGSIDSARIANAYIFYGPDGVGKKLAALNFAKAVNCANSSAGEACDNCPSCKKIDLLNHPDVRLTAPGKSGGSVKIDDIRDVITDASLKPYEAKKKFYIVDEANSLTEEAANALLKTLEEPSPNSTLVLITESLSRLFPTIRSRCQAVAFFLLDSSVIKDILVTRHHLDSVKAHVVASLSCGRLSEAMRLKDAEFFNRRSLIIDALSSGSISDWNFDKTPKTDLKMLLDVMLTWYRDILVSKAGGSVMVNIDKKDAISAEAKRADFGRLDDAIKRIISTQSHLDQNANPKLAMAALGMML